MNAALDWISGIAWSLVYLLSIGLGVRKKTYCIPAVCICLNFSWEIWVVLIRVLGDFSIFSGSISQLLWLVLDIGVLFTWFKYEKKMTTREKYQLLFLSVIAMAVACLGLGKWSESAFVINLVMSIAFLFQWDKNVYPSIGIAILKCLGTAPATVLNGISRKDFLITLIGGLCLIADIFYIFEVMRSRKSKVFTKEE